MTHPASPPKISRKLGYYLLLNVVLAVALAAAIPLIREGKRNYEPHAAIDKEYVRQVIASNDREDLTMAVKLTEISRAEAYGDYVQMLTFMQVVSGLLVVMVVGNIIMLLRVRSLKAALPAAETGSHPAAVAEAALPQGYHAG